MGRTKKCRKWRRQGEGCQQQGGAPDDRGGGKKHLKIPHRSGSNKGLLIACWEHRSLCTGKVEFLRNIYLR